MVYMIEIVADLKKKDLLENKHFYKLNLKIKIKFAIESLQ